MPPLSKVTTLNGCGQDGMSLSAPGESWFTWITPMIGWVIVVMCTAQLRVRKVTHRSTISALGELWCCFVIDLAWFYVIPKWAWQELEGLQTLQLSYQRQTPWMRHGQVGLRLSPQEETLRFPHSCLKISSSLRWPSLELVGHCGRVHQKIQFWEGYPHHSTILVLWGLTFEFSWEPGYSLGFKPTCDLINMQLVHVA